MVSKRLSWCSNQGSPEPQGSVQLAQWWSFVSPQRSFKALWVCLAVRWYLPSVIHPGGLSWFSLVCRTLLTQLYSILGVFVGNITGSSVLVQTRYLGAFRSHFELVHAPEGLLLLRLLRGLSTAVWFILLCFQGPPGSVWLLQLQCCSSFPSQLESFLESFLQRQLCFALLGSLLSWGSLWAALLSGDTAQPSVDPHPQPSSFQNMILHQPQTETLLKADI